MIKPTSKIADELFKQIMSFFPNHIIWTHLSKLREKRIFYNNSVYSLDFYDETTNTIIEFYGDYWHMNPKKYKENDIPDFAVSYGKIYKAKDIWEHDTQRINNIKKTILNASIIIIWESEYISNKETCINDIVKKINKKLKNNII